MKAWVLRENSFQIETIEQPKLNKGEVLIKLQFAALNHRDQWIRQGLYAKIQYPTVLGSDGQGKVIEIGEGVSETWLHQEVIINPNINWGDNPNVQSKQYQILGMPSQGTITEYIKVPIDRVHKKPEYLSKEEASALPLAGLTAYNALINKGKAEKDTKVLINGVGGGVAQMAFQFALKVGAKVWVTSSKEEVLDQCVQMGASGRVNYHRPDAFKRLKEESKGFDLIIDSAGGDQWNDLIKVLSPAGKLVFYGATVGLPSKLNLRVIFWNHITIQGSTMGSDKDFKNMLSFCEEYKVHPIIDRVFSFEEANEAFTRMEAGVHFGKIVIQINA